MQGIDLSIRTYGWHLTMVEDTEPWAYTIGLLDSFGHPEIVVTDLKREVELELVNWACSLIERHGRIDAAECERRGVEIVTVHGNHLLGDWFGTWHNFYGVAPPSGSFVQLLPPSDWFCECHQFATRRLDRPDGRSLENRAQRRARTRRRGR